MIDGEKVNEATEELARTMVGAYRRSSARRPELRRSGCDGEMRRRAEPNRALARGLAGRSGERSYTQDGGHLLVRSAERRSPRAGAS